MDFATFFERASSGACPYPYQRRLAEAAWQQTLVIPTGFGKTAAVLAAWLWKLKTKRGETPSRLVYCLPMRTLVEQTERTAHTWISAAQRDLDLDVELAVLMGGRDTEKRGIPDWIMHPERPTILVGTQDLLVSAALMRAYGANRYRWPVDFALLHNDALWVFDEVQLAGATLTTSAQLQAFREAFGHAMPSRTLWMSATLDREWLRTVDFTPQDLSRKHDIDLSDEDIARARHLWTARKALARLHRPGSDITKKDGLNAYAAMMADCAVERTVPNTNTIVFLNTVPRAQAVFESLSERVEDPARLLLIHSRFRAGDRATLTKRLSDPPPPAGRIVVATQALEAGVDVTSSVMITEIAPWSSLVQRFGRCNRYGECGERGAKVFWIDLPADATAPYEPSEMIEARNKLGGRSACGPADLAAIPPSAPTRGQVIRKRDLLDLFDTDPDLSGFDIDVSIYVRDADDTDVRLFWRSISDNENGPPEDAAEPVRHEICSAPIGRARELIKRANGRAWRWDALARQWSVVRDDAVFPGLVVWIDAAIGGYDPTKGFDHSSKSEVEPIQLADPVAPEALTDNRESLTSNVRVSLTRHTDHVYSHMVAVANALGLAKNNSDLLREGALWHDWGKAHEAFVALTRSALIDGIEPPLAKWPRAAKGIPIPEGARKYFRHELASALGFLAQHNWAEAASLSAYLIAAHHGKVRMRLRALPARRAAGQSCSARRKENHHLYRWVAP
jgi:CRISPR-associated endonuclease/helicase Cas3